MSSKPPPWLDPKPANVGTLVRGLLALGAIFVGAFALMRGSANAGIFLVLAVVCVGFALVSLFAQGLQRFGGSLLARSGRTERELLIGGLLVTALLTPWSIAIPPVHWPERFGWQSPLSLAVVAALVVVRVHRLRRYRLAAIVIAGIGLIAWIAWVSAQLLTPTFRNTGFPFLPIDLLGEGWSIALLALVITVDGMAVERRTMMGRLARATSGPSRWSQEWGSCASITWGVAASGWWRRPSWHYCRKPPPSAGPSFRTMVPSAVCPSRVREARTSFRWLPCC